MHPFLIILLYSTIICSLEVSNTYLVYMMGILCYAVQSSFSFPILCSVMSYWELEIDHDGRIYTREIGTGYKSDSPSFQQKLDFKHSLAYHWPQGSE